MVQAVYSQRQELFDELFKISTEHGFTTHLNNPPDGVGYPFVVIDPVTMRSRRLGKFKIAGTLSAVVHVWSHKNDVGTHDQMMFQIEKSMLGLEKLETVFLELESINPRTLNVTEGNEKLQHGIIEVTYKFN